MIWRETQLGNSKRVRELEAKLEEYQILYKKGSDT